MSYLDIIVKYYNNLYGSVTYKNNISSKNKKQLYISGRLKTFPVVFWLALSFIFIIVQLISILYSSRYIIMMYIGIGITVIASVVAIIATLLKTRKVYRSLEHEPLNLDLYKRDLPSNLRPAHVRMLLNDGLVDENSLCATLLDLIDRGYIYYINDNEEKIFKRTNKDESELFEFEKFLINWLIDKYGNGTQVTETLIKLSLKNDRYQENPSELLSYFQNRVWTAFPLEKYYNLKDDMKNEKLVYFILFMLGLLFIPTYVGVLFIIYGLGCVILATPYMYLNDKGVEEKDNWLDFKKHLVDFSNIEDKTTEMVRIWNFYLTYSVVLDIDSISSKEIKNIFKDDIYNSFENKSNTNFIEDEKIILKKQNKVSKTLKNDILEESKKYNL